MSTLNDLAPRVPDEIPTISELIKKASQSILTRARQKSLEKWGFLPTRLQCCP